MYIVSDIDKALAFEWIADRLDKKKFEISFILLNCTNESALQDYLKSNNIRVDFIKCCSKKDWIFVFFQLLDLFRIIKPNMVHCHLLTANILGLSAAKLLGIKNRIYTRHHSDYHFRYFPKGVRWDKFCNKLATCIIAPSASVQNVLIEREAVAVEKIELIHHGFDLDYFKNVDDSLKQSKAKQYNPNAQYPVMGVISRFTELKGIHYIIPAFQKLLHTYPNALLLLFNARGDYSFELDKLLSSLPNKSYQKIIFENDLAAVYSLFTVFTQVSTDRDIEAFGQTYVEALAAGVPSVFTLSGVANDFIKNEYNALVVPYCDSESIYNGWIKILSDDELVDKIRKNGLKSVKENFTLDQMIKKLENLYTKLSNL